MNRKTPSTPVSGALRDALPVILGYFPIAVAYGLTARNAGLSFFETVAVSVFVFAGASQFIAAGMIGAAANPVSIVLTVFLVNLRHFAMSFSLRHRFGHVPRILYPFVSFMITDETFSVASSKKILSATYLLVMAFPCYLSWVCGSGVGFLIGELLPHRIAESAEVTLYAMFAALLVPQAKKYPPAAAIAIAAAALYILLIRLHAIPGLAILVSVIAVAFVSALIIKDGDVNEA